MTNKEKFVKTFGIQPGQVCPVSADLCKAEFCGECSYDGWWDKPFKVKRASRPKTKKAADGSTVSRTRSSKGSRRSKIKEESQNDINKDDSQRRTDYD